MFAYLAEFEALANRIMGLPTPFLLSCFISGLIPEIRREVLALQPLSLVQAATLARLQEDKIVDARCSSRQKPPSHILQPISTLPPTPLLPLFYLLNPKLLISNSPRLRWHPAASVACATTAASATGLIIALAPSFFFLFPPRMMMTPNHLTPLTFPSPFPHHHHLQTITLPSSASTRY